ncbi:hypothetical protein BDN70DRAFT_449580 [Pholiota conissans]|uniref:Integral membrane protein n=1 Tax=Pholiota conissans TaxID=109636 RepID=A0A9P5Z913_9AGAR|nr:hypothetical protein BDN70DRAFT_449580 [Pholiota conissans]
MKNIWSRSTSFWLRVIYACPRYLGLAISIGNAVATSYIHIKYKVGLDTCQVLYSFHMISGATLLFLLEILLIFRLFALFGCKRSVGYLLLTLLGLKTVTIAILTGFSIRNIEVGDACLIEHISPTAVYISATELAFQTTIWSLTLYKYIRTHLEHGWQDIPLLSLVTWDGSWAFALLLVIYVVLLKDAISAFIPIPERTMRLRDICFPILVATLSFVTCRLVKNMCTFSPDPGDPESLGPLQTYETGTIQLTELHSMDDARY